MDHNQERRRGHFHRARRGPDRRGQERRTPQPQEQAGSGRDHVDVEQIMRDIRARIAQRSGVELSTQQIQDLAARRLEAILDPRSIKPALLDELRRGAATPAAPPTASEAAELSYAFEDTTLYESHRGVLRFIRRILSPILKLFFNPNPLIRALNIQSRVNADAARREADRERRQAEWNALHYEILHRLVTEVSRVTLEQQSQTMRIESLAAKVDFNERRVRGIEGAMHQVRPAAGGPAVEQGRGPRAAAATGAPAAAPAPAEVQATAPAAGTEGQPSDGGRRRRRRRRGRRGAAGPGEAAPGIPGPIAGVAAPDVDTDTGGPDVDIGGPEEEEGDEDEIVTAEVITAPVASEPEAVATEASAPETSAWMAEETLVTESITVEPIEPVIAESAAPEPVAAEPVATEPVAAEAVAAEAVVAAPPEPERVAPEAPSVETPTPPAPDPFTPAPPSDHSEPE
jgi:hypothetical protein